MRNGLIKVLHVGVRHVHPKDEVQWFWVEGKHVAYQCSEENAGTFMYFPVDLTVTKDYWVNRQRLELSLPLEYLK